MSSIRVHRFLLLTLPLLLWFCQSGQIVDISGADNLDKVIESEFKRLQMPGLAYAAVKNDSVVYMGTEGHATSRKTSHLPNRPGLL